MKKILPIINSFREQLNLYSLKNPSQGASQVRKLLWWKIRESLRKSFFAFSVTKKFGLP